MSKDSLTPRAEVAATLGLGRQVSAGARFWRWTVVVIALAAIGAASVLLFSTPTQPIRYQTAKIERGNLTVIVTATGTLQPTNQVDVGSELSGIVRTVEADFNDRVAIGQVLARLDTSKLESQVLQSQAAFKAAEARVLEAEANEDEMRRRLVRARELFTVKFVSEEALAAAGAAYKRAVAALDSARSQVRQARALLEVDRTNLGKAVIRSPINGTVLARRVAPGQTVAASFQAPVLFTLAEDLAKMELHVDVDEADVGQVREGQEAVFAVDAYPAQQFPSKVREVRNAAKTVSGVVTYETVLAVENPDLLLRPGMTGTAKITVSRMEGAVLVPNAALRFAPPAPTGPDQRSLVSRLLPGPPRRPAAQLGAATDRRHQQVWTLREGQPSAISVMVGATDGRMTQIMAGDVQPGLELLVDTLQAPK